MGFRVWGLESRSLEFRVWGVGRRVEQALQGSQRFTAVCRVHRGLQGLGLSQKVFFGLQGFLGVQA